MNTPIIKRAQREEQRRIKRQICLKPILSNAEIRRLHVSRMSVSHWYQTFQQKGREV